MPNICFYFQVHQPFRIGRYTVFDIGKHNPYFDKKKNRAIMEKVAKKCYIPTNKLMLKLINEHGDDFRIAYSISGTALDQFEEYAPEVLQLFQELADTGNVEFLNETYHHTLSFLFSKQEFADQVALHRKRVQSLFGQTPQVFRNTELVFNNELANFIEGMGYKAILAEGADHILGWRSPNFVYRPKTTTSLKLLLKNYKLSDDIAFRFGNKHWPEHPLTTDKFMGWVEQNPGHSVNLFMDYETIGEHQWEDTGIFKFFANLPKEARQRKIRFITPSEAAQPQPVDELDIHSFVSWADIERDLSAWLGNPMQNAAAKEIYQIEQHIKKSKDKTLLDTWRRLQTSDHLYYMCTKWFNDGDVHKYFNPYDSPYECYINYMNILNDLIIKLSKASPGLARLSDNPSLLIQ